jgi:hypothetical protein
MASEVTRVIGLMLGLLVVAACDGSTPAPLGPSPPPSQSSAGPPQGNAPPGSNPGGHPLEGSYSLTLDIGSGCPAIPPADRVRHYSADIAYTGDGLYVVTLTGSMFLSGLICTAGGGKFSSIGCDQFFASEDGNANFFLENNNDDAHGAHIVEQTSSGTWMEIIGWATGPVSSSSIDAKGTSSVWYCPASLGYPFPCYGSSVCQSDDMTLRFTRK